MADVADAARIELPFVDRTDEARGVEKIAAMKCAIGAALLAITSGITPEDVGGYLGIYDCSLVATIISSSVSELDAARVELLIAATHRGR